jgi:hypothetical protein
MGVFSSILAKLGFGSDKVEAAEQAAPSPEARAPVAVPQVVSISVVDVLVNLLGPVRAQAGSSSKANRSSRAARLASDLRTCWCLLAA